MQIVGTVIRDTVPGVTYHFIQSQYDEVVTPYTNGRYGFERGSRAPITKLFFLFAPCSRREFFFLNSLSLIVTLLSFSHQAPWQQPTREEYQASRLVRTWSVWACPPDVGSHCLPLRQRLPYPERGPERQLPGCPPLNVIVSRHSFAVNGLAPFVVVVDKAEKKDPFPS